MRVHPGRIQETRTGPQGTGPVIYWMSRDQRITDNWALVHAQDLALHASRPLRIVFCLADSFLQAGLRQYDFILRGLHECASLAGNLNIPLDLVHGEAGLMLPAYLEKHKASFLVMDFDPLRIKKSWQKEVLDKTGMPAHLVDAHNIVPCWSTSRKQEYAARTIRPRIHRNLDEFLDDYPEPKPHPIAAEAGTVFDPDDVLQGMHPDKSIPPVQELKPGPAAALGTLHSFILDKLYSYSEKRNDPNMQALSNLSPYLHFGHISAQNVALQVKKQLHTPIKSREAFLEELIVRKELSDNFCHYNQNYDNFQGLRAWAQKTLDKHRQDTRDYLYEPETLEQGLTHDPLWNAAQVEMVNTGKMHGYMRMYWAKKILEWTDSPEQAIDTAIYLNDRYELDGRDPNGYTGILWSMGGVHDRPWKERKIFGTVRYMSYNGCKRKFNVDAYIQKWI